jgi:serine/threonine protein kinase
LPDDRPAIEEAFRQAANMAGKSAFDDSNDQADSTQTRDKAAQTVSDAIPLSIGRYRVLRKLGAGSFGFVYLAFDPDLNRQVAIKCPKPAVWTTESRWQMFYHEAELAAKLRHPGVVAIHDIGRDESGSPFFVMEYIRGESLKERLARGRIDSQLAVQIIIAVAEALECIHQSGLVHCDLKPANVLLDDAGNPHIADLGLALDSQCAATSELAGTFAYMAPEQVPAERAAPDRPALDHRCDIWAVGVILYEMLAGRRPFEGTSRTELFHQILRDAPPRLSLNDAGVKSSVADVCMKCLAKTPGSRFASAGELAAALRSVRRRFDPMFSRRRSAIFAACALFGLLTVPTIFHRQSGNDSATEPLAVSALAGIAEKPIASQGPFVIRGTGQNYSQLYEAVDAAVDGATIEIDADGRLAVDQVNVTQPRLKICAARGRRPVLTLVDESRLCLLRTSGELVLEGLELQRGTPSSRATRNVPSVLVVEAPGSLRMKRCRIIFASTLKNRGPCIRAAQCNCLVEDSELYHMNGAGATWVPIGGARLLFDNCVVDAENLAVVRGEGHTPANAEVRRSTVRATQVFISLGALDSSADTKVQLKAERCYFDVKAVLIQIIPFPDGAPQTLDAVTNSIAWEGKQNVFVVRDTFIRSTFAGQQKSFDVDDLAVWNELWGTESGSVEISPAKDNMVSGIWDDSIPMREHFRRIAPYNEPQIGFVAGADHKSIGPEAGE